jgi:Raf kinase inhibitor-like YbhB/YbcL family protein
VRRGVPGRVPEIFGGAGRTLVAVAAAVLAAGCGGGGDRAAAPAPSGAAETITVTSSAFGDNQPIPRQFTCKGGGAAPELAWRGVPAGAESVALVVTDPDAPGGTFVHWVLYGLPPRDGQLTGARPPAGASVADNSGGQPGWTPPCPPSGTHHYHFTVYALRGRPSGSSTQDVLASIGGMTLARGELTGLVSAG